MITNAQLKAMLEEKIANYEERLKENPGIHYRFSLIDRINLCREILREIG